MSFNASASWVSATPNATFYINDPYYISGTDTYDVAVEVISQYPSDSYALESSNFQPANSWLPVPSTVQLSNIWYPGPPVSDDYYIMKIWVQKNGSGSWRSGWSYASISYIGSSCYVTANNNITVAI
jgi:hypothetical protein